MHEQSLFINFLNLRKNFTCAWGGYLFHDQGCTILKNTDIEF